MLRAFLILLALAACAYAQVKPEIFAHVSTSQFELRDVTKYHPFPSHSKSDPVWYLMLPELDTSVRLDGGVDIVAIRTAKEIRVGYLKTKRMQYAVGAWRELDYNDVIYISINNERVVEKSVCSVHGVRMRRVELPAVYGLINEHGLEPHFLDFDSYPHGLDVSLQGCIVPDPPYSHVKEFVCPECQRLYAEKMEQLRREQNPRSDALPE